MTLRQFLYRKIYLKTRYWKWLRRRVGERAGWRCEVMGCIQGGNGLNAHHRRYRLFMEWLHLRDLVYLCPRHHALCHRGFAQKLTRGRWLEGYGCEKI